MKAKPIILIIVTLVIGFVLGMLTSAQIRYSKLRPVRVFFSEDRFREGFYKMIQPDEKQKETIDQLLSKYARENGTLQGDFRKKMDSLMKDFWKELEPVLTKEQLDRMKEMEKRRVDMIRQNRRQPFDSTRFRDDRGPGMHDRRPPMHGPRDSAWLKDNKEQVVK
ncbi:MAG: hypothetical protein U0X39_14335 [Bacteroidales bacterium]